MRKRPLRGFWLRIDGGKGAAGQLLFSAILGLGLAFFLIHQFNAALRPQLVALAQAKLCNQLTRISNETVAAVLNRQELAYSDLVFIQPAPGGEISALTTDAIRLNHLRSMVMEEIVGQVEKLDTHSLGVPLGALTGVDLFSAAGPAMPVQVLSVVTAEGNYRNDFTGAGINQTLHRVLLDVTVTAKVLLPGGVAETTVSTPVCIAETVIIGQVPQTYLTLNQ